MKSRRTWWLIFGACCVGVFAALLWVSAVVLRLEAQAQHQQWMRLALWRMDAWLGPQLREEANRPYFEYLPFYPQERAYTRILNEIEPGEVYSPSPLLTYESDIFALHFQLDCNSALTSPQAPKGNWRDLAEAAYLEPEALGKREKLLEHVSTLVGCDQMEICVDQAQVTLAQLMGTEFEQPAPAPTQRPAQLFLPNVDSPNQTVQTGGKTQQAQTFDNDFQQRVSSNYNAQQEWNRSQQIVQQKGMSQQKNGSNLLEVDAVEIGLMTPVWIDSRLRRPSNDRAPTLLLVRQVDIGEQRIYQGVLVDWPKLQAQLLTQVQDLFPRASLSPVYSPDEDDVDSGKLLGGLPVMLDAPCAFAAAGPLITPARTTLGMTWLAVIIAVLAAGVTLRASIHFGEKRSRFASAVTHELRTPLTTFRMYSEMLAEGMIRDESQKQSYLQTLKSESNRLAALVENVLSYARLEDGRAVSHAQQITINGLLERIKGVLMRRANDCRMELEIEQASNANDSAIEVDVEVVGQILFNLIDNACKYATAATDRRIHIRADSNGSTVSLLVRDHGPGIPPEFARKIFAPFDRGPHKPGDTIPGVGLGLALARGLARDLGGDLTLDQSSNGSGACFRLQIPKRQT